MARFTAIPSVPTGNVTEWQGQIFRALKEDVELLAGIRGEADLASKAVTRGQLRVNQTVQPTFSRVSATGKGYTISGQNVPDLDDYGKLINDVQLLANDVATLRNVVNLLIAQLKG
jgi:2-keto-3-deoxy-L-rhamnonate aldolase RhmA